MREFKEIKGACLTTWNRRGGGGGSWVMELSVDDNIDQYQHCLNGTLNLIISDKKHMSKLLNCC